MSSRDGDDEDEGEGEDIESADGGICFEFFNISAYYFTCRISVSRSLVHWGMLQMKRRPRHDHKERWDMDVSVGWVGGRGQSSSFNTHVYAN